MKTLILEKAGEFVLRETPEPNAESLAQGEVLVRVHHVGLCGTDIHAYHGRQPFFTYPRILGHELGVEVEAVGPRVTAVQKGDLCCVEPYLAEPVDRAFKRGKTNCSQSTKCLGVHVDGGMRTLIVLPEDRLHPSRKLDTRELALVEPLCIGHHAVERSALIGDELVAVVGLGPIGLGVIQFAMLSGAKVVGVDVNPKRIAKARELYPSLETLCPDPDSGVLKAWDAAWPERPEVVFECTGNKASMEASILLPGYGGRIVLVGIYNGDLIFSDPDFHKRELSILASRNATGRNFRSVIQLIESGLVDVHAWVTHQCNVVDFPGRITDWLEPDSSLLKGIISFQEE